MAKKKKKKNQIQIPIKYLIVLVIIVAVILIICLCIPNVRTKLFEIASNFIEIETEDNNMSGGSGESSNTQSGSQGGTSKFNSNEDGDMLAFITMIDVGQGDAIYIALPDGKDMLIDGGKNNNDAETLLMNYLQATVTDGFIDYVMLTHTDEDHCGGLDKVFAQFDVGAVYMPYISASYGQDGAAYIKGTCSTKVYYDFYTAAIGETYEKDGQTVSCAVNYNVDNFKIEGENYSFDVYCKPQSEYEQYFYKSGSIDPNDFSPIMFLDVCGIKICFTGDANFGVEDDVMAKIAHNVDVDILKIGHHGSKTSTDTDFIQFLTPEYGIVSAGEGNKYGHPTPEALQRLEAENVTVYRTDISGDITVKIYDDSYSFAFSK